MNANNYFFAMCILIRSLKYKSNVENFPMKHAILLKMQTCFCIIFDLSHTLNVFSHEAKTQILYFLLSDARVGLKMHFDLYYVFQTFNGISIDKTFNAY